MEARMTHPVAIVPEAMQALQALGKATRSCGVSEQLLELLHLRASQINGCSVCLHMHAQSLRKGGETDERIDTVAGWRDSPWFTDAERAALALTEALTRIADRPDPVSDELWAEVRAHYDERGVSGLLLAISGINVWNRLNAATRQVPGAF